MFDINKFNQDPYIGLEKSTKDIKIMELKNIIPWPTFMLEFTIMNALELVTSILLALSFTALNVYFIFIFFV